MVPAFEVEKFKVMNTQNDLFALKIEGGAYNGHYVNTHTGDGWYDTTTDIALATMRDKGTTESRRTRFCSNAQWCYINGAKAVVVKAN